MEVTFRIFRFDPLKDKAPYYKDYKIETAGLLTVLEGLKKIKEEIDGTLSFRSSCRQAICGSCGMRINHFTKLACKTHIEEEAKRHNGMIVVEPMKNMVVLKDLIVDLTKFWDQMNKLRPWLIQDPSRPPPEREYLMLPEQVKEFQGTPNCIFCGACYSECQTVDVDKDFPGPAALAKHYRFAIDIRDAGGKLRLEEVIRGGLWWCVRCYLCVEACPKNVRPGEVITYLRELAHRGVGVMELGGKHAQAFLKNIEKYGILNEAELIRDTLGIGGMLKHLPKGIKMGLKGKLVTPFQKPIEGIDEVRKLYKELM